jgi:chromosome partitioning protein
MAQVLATVNQKGGVGKTTTAINISAFMAILGKKVLLIDFDPQGNASSGLGVDREKITKCVYDVIINQEDLNKIIIPTVTKDFFVAPATSKLAGAEVELVPLEARERKLKDAIDKVKDQYDYIVIDCPPSLSLLTVNALTAANEVIIPLQCEYYALEGLSQLTKTLDLIRASLNPDLKIRGVVLTMYDPRTLLSQEVAEEARNHLGDLVFKTVIPRNVRLSEAPSFGQPIIYYDPTCSGAVAYESLSKEILNGAH